jgi:hypothetical protein
MSRQARISGWVERKLKAGCLLVTVINALRRAKAESAETMWFSMFSIYRHGRKCSLFAIYD